MYPIGTTPAPSCDTSDLLSGVATPATRTVTGGNPDGTGIYTITCAGAVDNAGNTTPAVVATYEIHYTTGPEVFTGGPVAAAPAVNNGKAGRVYPLQWALTGEDGTSITDLAVVISISTQPIDCVNITGPTTEISGAESTGNGLSVTSSGNYTFNWITPPTPGCYRLSINLADGNTLTANFNLT